MIVARAVRQAGYGDADFEEAANGAQALAAIKADAPDLVLSDGNMPEMNGIELLRALNDEGISVPFGFVTSESTGEMREQGIAAGALFLMAKPLTAEGFGEVVPSVVRGGRRRRRDG